MIIDKKLLLVNKIQNGYKKEGTVPELWDGKAADRISEILVSRLIE